MSGTTVTLRSFTPVALNCCAKYDVFVSTICPRKISSPITINPAVYTSIPVVISM